MTATGQSRKAESMDRARNGKARIGGPAPYGYVMVDGAFDVHPEHATWVRVIFDMRDAGCTVRAIASALTRAGIPSPAGMPTWGYKTVANIVNRRAFYAGMTTIIDGVNVIPNNARMHWPILHRDAR